MTGAQEEASTEIGKRIQGATHIHELVSKLSRLKTRTDVFEEVLDLARQTGTLSGRLKASRNPGEQASLRQQIQDLTKQQDELNEKKIKASEIARGETRKALLLADEGRHASVAATDTDRLDDAQRQSWDSGSQWLSGLVGKGAAGEDLPAFQTRAAENGRAYYTNISHTVSLGAENSDIGAAVAAHEISHGIEWKLPGVQQACQEFLEHRLKGQKPQKLKEAIGPEYGDDEEGANDDFARAFSKDDAWYVGKRYPLGSTEILSMGVEKLYSDPVNFARHDPEYCAFVVGVLHGDLRGTRVADSDPVDDYFA
jgi:hypothetical protein